MRWTVVVGAAGLLVGGLVQAGPVTDAATGSEAAESARAAAPAGVTGVMSGRELPAPAGAGRPPGAAIGTGNKNLDLLLEMQAAPATSAGPAMTPAQAEEQARRDAAAAKAARERLQALGQRLPGLGSAGEFGADGHRAAPTTDARGVPNRAPQREWIPPPAGATGGGLGLGGLLGGGSSGGSGGSGLGGGESPSEQLRRMSDTQEYAPDDSVLRALPPEIRAFLRDNRYLILGAGVLLALVGAIVKLYSRRI